MYKLKHMQDLHYFHILLYEGLIMDLRELNPFTQSDLSVLFKLRIM